ncbi:hypothetical protein F2Q70_00030004 [Brassica cretica]|uniref:Uncharacterized protein n=2 Tax=Brassica cretica TaxID=69181 RepID=A0A3N6TIK3_BRACR|nr:hypothetical protein F2Q70_00030004 [Brassica cretica]KAF3486994.1 hypothetical protein F2Q69_00053273 [Brassica cretica]KAF3590653.1 hypothetical protein DY000_02022303 [Brassica cretica]
MRVQKENTSLGGPEDLSLRTWRLLGTSALAHEDIYLFHKSSGRGAALETWRGTDPEFPREFVGGGRSLLFRGAIGFHLHVRWVAGDPGPISGTWDPGPGIWYLGSGTWKPEPGTQRMQRSIVPGAWTGILSRNNSNGS